MNPGQERFYYFILERVGEEYKDAAKELLTENFRKQAEGTFARDDMLKTQEALMKMLKPETVEEVKTAMAHFASQMERNG